MASFEVLAVNNARAELSAPTSIYGIYAHLLDAT
jgi:hypothetical protein